MWLVRMIYSDAERVMHFCEEEKESRKKRMGKRDLTKLASQINLGGFQRPEVCVYARQYQWQDGI